MQRDLTFALESQPTQFTWSLHRDGLDQSGSAEFARHFAAVIGWRHSLAPVGSSFGVVLGGEAALAQGTLSDGGHLESAELRGLTALAWSPDPAWTVQAGLRGSIGVDRFSFTGVNDTGGIKGGSGFHRSLAPELSLWWQPSGRWRVFASAGWRMSELTGSGGGLDLTLRQSGPTYALGFTWMLSLAPTGLD